MKALALITGASSGIGRELARVFAARGHDLVIVARRAERLDALAEELSGAVHVTPMAVDLAKAKGPRRLHSQIRDAGLEVGVLVNNAGVAEVGAYWEQSLEKQLDMVNLNVRALTELSARFAGDMRVRGGGRILNVASVASFQPVPGMAVYSATKAYVLSLTESLSEEFRGSGVTITALCPGLTRTELVEGMSIGGQKVPEILLADAAGVAREGYQACMQGEAVRVPGVLNQALVTWTQAQPRWLNRLFSGVAARSTFAAKRGESGS